jgi:predicted  nucleic acid-binding Zn-ribbon protein
MLPDLERLITLQEIDTRAANAAKTIADAPGRIAALDALLQEATRALDAARQHVADNQAARRVIEKDLAVVQQRQSKYKDQLMEVKTNVEYHAMQHQIAAAAEEVGQYEEKILVKMLEADEQQAALKKAEAALKAAQAKVQTERTAIEQEARAQATVATDSAEARQKLIGEMDDDGLIGTFERIVKVRGTAVARAADEHCTVCRVRLRPIVFATVRRNDSIVQCDSCQRILYFVPGSIGSGGSAGSVGSSGASGSTQSSAPPPAGQ